MARPRLHGIVAGTNAEEAAINYSKNYTELRPDECSYLRRRIACHSRDEILQAYEGRRSLLIIHQPTVAM